MQSTTGTGSCGCEFCLRGEYNECQSLAEFSAYPQSIRMKLHTFREKKNKKKEKTPASDIDDEEFTDLNEEEANEWEEGFIETEASKFIQEGDFAVIKTGDDHQYYLLKLDSAPYVLQEETTDDIHTFPPLHRVVKGNYLEQHKETSDGSVYYIDYKHTAMISAFCLIFCQFHRYLNQRTQLQ